MDRDIILRKLDSLARCVRRIETKRPPNLEELVFDIVHHRIVDFRVFSQSVNDWSDRHK